MTNLIPGQDALNDMFMIVIEIENADKNNNFIGN